MQLVPTILCGGAGARLWPLSREEHPKPFITLPDGQSLLQKAFTLGSRQPAVQEMLVVTNGELLFKIMDECARVNDGQLPLNFILEPVGRNTAPAVTCAALEVQARYGPEATLLVLAADHLINDQPGFAVSVAQAVELAARQKLVTFGIKPDAPETGYGYIKAQEGRVLAFVEKPSSDLARQYLASGDYFWNAGIFCFQAGTVLQEMQQHCPQVYDTASKSLAAAIRKNGRGEQVFLDEQIFTSAPDISIDYAVMEKTERIAMVEAAFDWNDVGSWRSLCELNQCDQDGNCLQGPVVAKDVTNCFIQSQDRVVGALGINNLIIIDTADALLVAEKSKDQDVKQIYNQLKEQRHMAYKQHSTVIRPWGTYTVLEGGPNFKIKRIVVNPGASLSLQMHYHRSEHWIVVSGTAQVINGDKEMFIATNESTYIPATHKHRLSNPGTLPLVIIEVQSGQYLDEDDIVRFDDDYGRASS